MIGSIARKHLDQHREGAVDKGKFVSAHYLITGWAHVDDLRIDLMTEKLIDELVQMSSEPGAGSASALGLVCEVEHPEARRIIMTFKLSNDGRDVGCIA